MLSSEKPELIEQARKDMVGKKIEYSGPPTDEDGYVLLDEDDNPVRKRITVEGTVTDALPAEDIVHRKTGDRWPGVRFVMETEEGPFTTVAYAIK